MCFLEAGMLRNVCQNKHFQERKQHETREFTAVR